MITYDLDAMMFKRSKFGPQGEIKNWENAFVWHRTPQGVEFWIAQSRHLTDEGRSALDAMIDQYEHQEQSA